MQLDKEISCVNIQNKEAKLSPLLANGIIVSLANSKEATFKKLLGCVLNIKKSIVFLFMRNNQLEMKTEKHFICISDQNYKIQWNLTIKVQNSHGKN